MHKKSRLLYLVIPSALTLVLAACSGSGQPQSTTKTYGPDDYAPNAGQLTLRLSSEWKDFNIQATGDAFSQSLIQNGYETLLAQDEAGKLTGYLATSWQATPTSITFTLQKDATCADGTVVTPTIVKNSLQRMIDNKAPYNRANWGPGPYTVTADDAAGTVKFETATPYGPLEYGFSNTFSGNMTGIVCPAGLAPGADLTTKMYGSGPYELVDAVHGDHVTFKLRSDWKGGPGGISAQTPGLAQTVVYKIITDDTTATNLLRTGGLDVANIAGPNVPSLLNDPTYRSVQTTTWVPHVMSFNENPGHPTTDKVLRQALITALDPNAYSQAVFQGRGVVSKSVATPDVECYDPEVEKLAPTPSVDAAKTVLANGGYTLSDGKLMKDGQQVSLHLIYGNLYDPAAEYVTSQWQQLGINVQTDNQPYQQWVAQLVAGQQDATLVTTLSPGPIMGPPSQRLTGPGSPAGTNYSQSNDPALNDAQAKAIQLTGTDACAAWSDYQKIMWQNWDMLPLVAPYDYVFSSSGWYVAPTNARYPYPIQVHKLKNA